MMHLSRWFLYIIILLHMHVHDMYGEWTDDKEQGPDLDGPQATKDRRYFNLKATIFQLTDRNN